MAKRRGRPPKQPQGARTETLYMRLSASEKEAFAAAAELAGLDVSAWARERLRQTAKRELEKADQPVPFLGRPDQKGQTE